MDFENERQVLSSAFKNFWESATITALVNPSPAVQWNNISFTQPNTTVEAAATPPDGTQKKAPWVRFNILNVNTLSAAVGGTTARTNGIMAIQLFMPGLGGTKLARQLADALSDQFSNTELECARGWLHFQFCGIEDYGHNDGYYQMNANLPFWRDTRRNPQEIDGGQITEGYTSIVDGGVLT
jgi:hypothetical protein